MTVRVRLFAAVRDAAGTAEATVEPGRLSDILDELRDRYGEPFRARLAVSTVLVDGSATSPGAGVEVPDGAEIAVLPPVSGGAGTRRRPRPRRRRQRRADIVPPGGLAGADPPLGAPATPLPASAGLGGLLGAATAAALAAGHVVFGVAVVSLAALVLADLAARLSRPGPRPITLAAAVPGVALPATIALRPETGWTAVPDFAVGGVLAAFLVALVFGRRRNVTAALGRTLLCGLVVGLGAAGLLLLVTLPDGFRWTLAAVVVLTVVEAVRQAATARASPAAAGAGTVLVALVAAGVLTVAVPPFTLASAAAFAAVALVAGATAGLLREALEDVQRPAGDPGTARDPRGHAAVGTPAPETPPAGWLHAGVLTDAALPLLLGSPVAYAFARLAAL